MTDFPSSSAQALPTHIGSYSRYGLFWSARSFLGGGSMAARTWVANVAVYVPIFVPFAYPVSRFWWANGTTVTSTNVDCGIYSVDGILLASCGSTAMSGTNVIQYQAATTPIILQPGSYYLGWTCNNTTSRAQGWPSVAVENARCAGILQQASALPLPASWTPAVWDATVFTVWCGFTRYATGF